MKTHQVDKEYFRLRLLFQNTTVKSVSDNIIPIQPNTSDFTFDYFRLVQRKDFGQTFSNMKSVIQLYKWTLNYILPCNIKDILCYCEWTERSLLVCYR